MNSFDLRVRNAVRRIPYGKVATYSQIAELIGAYGAARQVGWSLARLSLPCKIPWHRVLNVRGSNSMRVVRQGSDWMQRQLLIEEGIPVDASGHLSLREFLYDKTDFKDSFQITS